MVFNSFKQIAANRRGRALEKSVVGQRQARANANAYERMVRDPVQYLVEEVVKSVKTTELWTRYYGLHLKIYSRRNASKRGVTNVETLRVINSATEAGRVDLDRQYVQQLQKTVYDIIVRKYTQMQQQMLAYQQASQQANQRRQNRTQRTAQMFYKTLR